MQTPVRFYITEGDDRPVVRTIPVPVRATEQKSPNTSPVAASDRATSRVFALPGSSARPSSDTRPSKPHSRLARSVTNGYAR